ncbi:MAG: hypothetical protein U0Q18_27105 [Bryobacteraceae bacterium]
MRPSLSILAFSALVTLLAAPQGGGVLPRHSITDYPVHQVANNATVAAALLPPAQVKKMFPGDVIKDYAVVEVAVYPTDGARVEIDTYDFALKLGADEMSHPRIPQEIASIWNEDHAPRPGRKVDVVTETGVVYTSGNDPYNGRTKGWGTYTGVGVVTPGSPHIPPPPGFDVGAVQHDIWAKALPEGPTTRPVAGYLYFPLYNKKHKSVAKQLQYMKDTTSVALSLPAK